MTTSFPGFPGTTHDNKVLPPPLRSYMRPNSNSSSPPLTTHSRIALPLFLSSPFPLSITSLSSPSSHNSPLPKPYRHPTSTSHLLRKTLTSSVRPLANLPASFNQALAHLSHLIPSPRIPYLLPNPPTSSVRTPSPPRYLQQSFSFPPNKQSILIVSKAMYLFLFYTSL